MKSLIGRLNKHIARFFAYIAAANDPPPNVKPEDWWRCQMDRIDY